jgi:hypothetical protein
MNTKQLPELCIYSESKREQGNSLLHKNVAHSLYNVTETHFPASTTRFRTMSLFKLKGTQKYTWRKYKVTQNAKLLPLSVPPSNERKCENEKYKLDCDSEWQLLLCKYENERKCDEKYKLDCDKKWQLRLCKYEIERKYETRSTSWNVTVSDNCDGCKYENGRKQKRLDQEAG